MTRMRPDLIFFMLAWPWLEVVRGFGTEFNVLHEMEKPGCMESRRLTISTIYAPEATAGVWSVPSGAPISVKIKGRANVDITPADGIALFVIPVAVSRGVWPDEEYGGTMIFSFCEQWGGVQCPMPAGTEFEAVVTWNAIRVSTRSMGTSPILLSEPGVVSCFAVHYDIVPEIKVDPHSPFSVSHPIIPDEELEAVIKRDMVERINAEQAETWTAEMSPRFHNYSVADARRIAADTVLRGHEPSLHELRPRIYTKNEVLETYPVPLDKRRVDGVSDMDDVVCMAQGQRSSKPDARERFQDESLDGALKVYFHQVRRMRNRKPVRVAISPEDVIPESFDAREAFPECVSRIGRVIDQGDCGSSWAIASTEVFNDRRCIAAGRGRGDALERDTSLSAMDTTACSGYSRGCNGGYTGSAWKWFVTSGVVTGAVPGDSPEGTTCKPYEFMSCAHHVSEPTGIHPRCPTVGYPKLKCSHACWEKDFGGSYESSKRKAKDAYSLMDTVSMQIDMMRYGPITASFSVHSDFLAYAGGVYKYAEGEYIGGHTSKIIGWGTDKATGEEYWLAVNSWGSSWGEAGLFRILRGANECGIEGQMVAGEA